MSAERQFALYFRYCDTLSRAAQPLPTSRVASNSEVVLNDAVVHQSLLSRTKIYEFTRRFTALLGRLFDPPPLRPGSHRASVLRLRDRNEASASSRQQVSQSVLAVARHSIMS